MKDITKMTDEEILNLLKSDRAWMEQLGYTAEELEAMNQYQPSNDELEALLDLDEEVFDDCSNEIFDPIIKEFWSIQ